MEKRKPQPPGKRLKSSDLPKDYIQMVEGVFLSNFSNALKKLETLKSKPKVRASGAIFPDEIILTLAVLFDNHLAATTLHASVDFDPKASSPKAEELLAAALDAQGAFFQQILFKDEERLRQIAEASLSAFAGEELPFQWTEVEMNRRKVWLKIDKSNPELEEMADRWLEDHDPQEKKRIQEENQESEELFRTPDKMHKSGDEE